MLRAHLHTKVKKISSVTSICPATMAEGHLLLASLGVLMVLMLNAHERRHFCYDQASVLSCHDLAQLLLEQQQMDLLQYRIISAPGNSAQSGKPACCMGSFTGRPISDPGGQLSKLCNVGVGHTVCTVDVACCSLASLNAQQGCSNRYIRPTIVQLLEQSWANSGKGGVHASHTTVATLKQGGRLRCWVMCLV